MCRARYRSQLTCPRCGANLRVLMLLSGQAYRLRQAARQALREGACARACQLAEEAQRLCAGPEGRRLAVLARFLASVGVSPQERNRRSG